METEKIFRELLERYFEGGNNNLSMSRLHYQKIVMRLTKNLKENINLDRQFGGKGACGHGR